MENTEVVMETNNEVTLPVSLEVSPPETEIEQEYTSVPKMDYEYVDEVFSCLNYSFHPNGFDNGEEIDPRMITIWNVFLSMVGWTEEEYWAVSEAMETEMTPEELHAAVSQEVSDMIEEHINSKETN